MLLYKKLLLVTFDTNLVKTDELMLRNNRLIWNSCKTLKYIM